MRIFRSGVVLVVVVLLTSSLVSGCELREGDPREYGHASGVELDAR
jgi:hypothetical protein